MQAREIEDLLNAGELWWFSFLYKKQFFFLFDNLRFEDESVYNLEPGGAAGGAVTDSQIFINPLTSDQFPALGRNSSDNTHLVSKNYTKFGNAAFNREDFPTLGMNNVIQ